MCFSPSASFGASVVLASTGAIAVSLSKNNAQKVLACVPVLFALQQFSEGVLWMSLRNLEWAHLKQLSTYVFLLFAQVIWPAYIPVAMLLFEKQKQRRTVMQILAAAGLMLSVYTLYCLINYPVIADADHHHIRYTLGFTLSEKWYYGLFYFLPTIVAPMLSSTKMLRWLGGLFLVSYAFTRLLFHLYVISVWCFFGAIISLVIVLMIYRLNKRKYSLA